MFLYKLFQHGPLCGQYLSRVVLHPARLGKDLGKLLLRDPFNHTGLIEKNCTGTGRSLIKRYNIFHINLIIRPALIR
jgi:hypothetical protein